MLIRLTKLIGNIFFFIFLSYSAFSQTATIKGNIYDNVTRDGLPGAYVSVNNTSFKRAADDKGNFQISGIPPGEYEVTIENVGYSANTRHIVLKAGESFRLFAGLRVENKSLNEVTVFGGSEREKEFGSRNRERNAANITNIISSQAMVRSPDINAANVLQRMSGITVQRSSGGDEAYAVIRGMEPRYNNTLLNGIKIASPDNKNRFVQLDIIPSDILSSIEISKSLLPDMEGDAIGGTVNMVVKDAPDITSFKATTSFGYSQLFFDEKFIDFKKSVIQKLSPIQRNPLGYAAQPGDFTRTNLDFQPRQAPPTATLGFSYSQRFMHNKIGIVLADNVQNQYYGNISSRFTVSPTSVTSDTLQYLDDTNFKGYTQQLNNGMVAHFDYVFNERNKVNVDNFFIYSLLAQARLSEDTTLLGTGRIGPGTGQIFDVNQTYTQHQYIENLKVSGQHSLSPNLYFDWAGVLSEAGRRVPDLAAIETDYRIQADYSRTGTFFDQITRQWLKNDDKDYTGLLNLNYHKKINGNDIEFKAGGLYRSKSRFNNEDDYVLRPPSNNGNGGGNSKPAWTNIYAAQWDVFNSSGTNVYNPNNYKAAEIVFAEYLMARYKSNKWELGGGLRVENTSTNWDIRVHSPTQPSSGNQTYQDFLPSVFLKYKLSKKENLHFSYFRSISRPNYYELVPAPVFAGDFYINGNPGLQRSVADNFDIRYEIFPKGEEHLFLGMFYKQIQNPIEQSLNLRNGSGGIPILNPTNSSTANNYGAELAFTKYWGRFGVTGNYTYTHSAISSLRLRHAGGTTNETRPMQGQTDHIANVSLLYKDVKKGFFAQLAYEYQGTTLSQISFYYQSDYYQKPMNTLAFSLEKDLYKHFTLFGKFNNLLNTPSIQYVQSTLVVSKDIYKASYSIGIRYSH
jgi:Outer membrane protein beta-barrel family/CarboxypepD_reg-like domain/TonB-dependent Receptor Plug Domain